jgi:metal-responsive CopG/Arc/MetJ family transcriptional regulator
MKERIGIKIDPKIVRVSIEIPEQLRDDFRDAVERNGKSMKDVLKLYMQKYTWKQSELQRNRQKRRQSIGIKI